MLSLVDVMKQIIIPSVFVGEETANSLKEDYMYDKGWVFEAPLLSTNSNIKSLYPAGSFVTI